MKTIFPVLLFAFACSAFFAGTGNAATVPDYYLEQDHTTGAVTATRSFTVHEDSSQGSLFLTALITGSSGIEVNGNVLLRGDVAGMMGMNANPGAGPGQTLTVTAGSPAVGSADQTGGELVLSGGNGTGLGSGGNVRVQTAGAGPASGTAYGTSVDRRIIVAKAKSMTLASPGFTSLMSIALSGTNTAGGRIHYTIRATDGASQIATEAGVIQYVATANSITCTIQPTDKLHLGTVNSGCSPGFFNPGSQPGIGIFDTVSFSVPAAIAVHEVYFEIENTSGSAIRLEP